MSAAEHRSIDRIKALRVFRLSLLGPIAAALVWVALAAWTLAFVGLARYLMTQRSIRPSRRAAGAATASPAASTGERST